MMDEHEIMYYEDLTEQEISVLTEGFTGDYDPESFDESVLLEPEDDDFNKKDTEDFPFISEDSGAALYGHDFYLRDLKQRYDLLSQDEMMEVLDIYNRDSSTDEEKKAALEKIFNSIDPLIEKMAKSFVTRYKDMDDLVSEAHLKILESGALSKYNNSKGKLSSYLHQVVKNTWIASYPKENTLSGASAKIQRFDTAIRLAGERFYMENGRYPTEDELAYMDIFPTNKKNATHEQKVNIVHETRQYCRQSKLLPVDSVFNADHEGTIDMDRSILLRDSSAEEMLENCENISLYDKLRDLMRDVLSPREYAIMMLCNGVYTDKCYTTNEIAQEIGISRGRVGQLYLKARKKLEQRGLNDSKRSLF